LKNGAKATNIFWAIGTAVTTGTSTFFAGQILAQTAVTLRAQSALRQGRAFAKTSCSATSGALVSFSFLFLYSITIKSLHNDLYKE
jgi:hypothetical protein